MQGNRGGAMEVLGGPMETWPPTEVTDIEVVQDNHCINTGIRQSSFDSDA